MRDIADRRLKTHSPAIVDARYREATRLVCAALFLALIVLASQIASFW